MNTNAIFAIATVLALGGSATTSVARNLPTNEPGAAPATASGMSMPKDSSINYGSRAQVRIYRPDGIYDVRDGYYVLSPSGFGDADTDTPDD
ncbi:MAG: hypothetical protein K8F92_10345 [Hyphomicrobium sp.]|uniref:hypothetical protein n=1 Tax=Hyphomicrobium sp. TaxID=82 RepID=UPI001329EF32|nr:hypothetical protein [Hyphomicrobium sp.]KAB2940803.1 MAG: hypothetical protein F9K20_11940 [Hyphomicrobium sp.]MBZ0210037.1 hypothetical protein [Hyphomicrobium sp.]